MALSLCVLAGCERPSATPAPIANRGGEAPVVTERPWPEMKRGADHECVAEPPRAGIVDRSSTAFARIDVRRGDVRIEERATFRRGPVLEVTASTGGCAHVGTSYRFVLTRTAPVTDRAHYVDRALAALAALPVRGDARLDARRDIADGLKQVAPAGDCTVMPNEMVTVSCSVEEEPRGVVVELAYDVAL